MKLIRRSTTSKNISSDKKEKIDYEQLGRMLANIYETGYIDRNQAYKMSFLKGIATGLGSVIGATLVLAAIITLLAIFSDSIPFLQPFLNPVQESLQSRSR